MVFVYGFNQIIGASFPAAKQQQTGKTAHRRHRECGRFWYGCDTDTGRTKAEKMSGAVVKVKSPGRSGFARPRHRLSSVGIGEPQVRSEKAVWDVKKAGVIGANSDGRTRGALRKVAGQEG